MTVKVDFPQSFIYQLDDLNAKRQPEIEYYYEDLLGIRNDTFNTEILAGLSIMLLLMLQIQVSDLY